MNPYHEVFISSINQKKLVKLKVDSKEKGVIERICVPYDFGPSRRPNLKSYPDKYHFFHKETGHPTMFDPEQIVSIVQLDQEFNPADYINWQPPYHWHTPRNWGIYS